MISLSGHLCAHSAPTAPAWNFCSQIVQTMASAEISANGTSAMKSRHRTDPLRHQTHKARTAGNMTVDGLLAIAKIKNSRPPPNRHQRPLRCDSVSNFKKQKVDKR